LNDREREMTSVIISVKGGHVTSSQVRDLRGVIEREEAAIGVFITLEPATKNMRKEAADAGFWQTKSLAGTKHPRLAKARDYPPHPPAVGEDPLQEAADEDIRPPARSESISWKLVRILLGFFFPPTVRYAIMRSVGFGGEDDDEQMGMAAGICQKPSQR